MILLPKGEDQGGGAILFTLLFGVVILVFFVAGTALNLDESFVALNLRQIRANQFISAIFFHYDFLHLIVAGFALYLAGIMLENRGGFAAFLLTFFVGAVMGEVIQVLIFSGVRDQAYICGAEGGAIAAAVAGYLLWSNDKLRFGLPWKEDDREVSGLPWLVAAILLIIAYDFYLTVRGTLAGWGNLIGGLITGAGMVPVLSILGVKHKYTTQRVRAETDAAISQALSTLRREQAQTQREERLVDPNALEEKLNQQIAERDKYPASLTAVKLIDYHLRRNRPDEARRILKLIEDRLGEIRVPGKMLLAIAHHCLDMALIGEAKQLAHRLVNTQFDTPGLDELLFRLIEVLVDTSSTDLESAEYFLSRYRLLSPPPQYYEYLRGKLYKLKALQELTPEDEHIVELIDFERYEDALNAIRERGDEVRVPPDALLTLARGLLMLPAFEDAAEVLALIAHLHPEASETPEAVYQLIQIFHENLNDDLRAERWYQFLKETFPNAPATALARSYFERIRQERFQRRQ